MSNLSPPLCRLPTYWIEEENVQLQSGQRVDWGVEKYNLTDIFKHNQGEGVHVAIIDSGWPQGGHPDLPEVLHNRNYTNDGAWAVRSGHGCHVAGIIGARNNDTGMVGVAPKCEMSMWRALGEQGSGMSTWIAQAVRDAADFEPRPHIINMSLGGPYWKGTHDALKYANSKGIICVVAAGNAGERGMDYPALHVDETIAVASTRSDGRVSDFSSKGEAVWVAAPGEKIYSTWPGNRYNAISGTSMAAPFVSGLIALMLSSHTDSSMQIDNTKHLKKMILDYIEDIGAPGHDRAAGHGIIRIQDFIDAFRSNVSKDGWI